MIYTDHKRVTGDGDSFQADCFGGNLSAVQHFLRTQSAEAVDRGILIRHRGMWLGHRVLFPAFVVEVAQRAARRAVDRARASDVHSVDRVAA